MGKLSIFRCNILYIYIFLNLKYLSAFRKEDSKGFAVKCLDKEKSKDTFKRILEEGNVLRQLDHKAIVKFEEQIETKDKFFIVLELAPGGELFDMIVKKTRFEETQAKMYFYQMASAVQVYIIYVSRFDYDFLIKLHITAELTTFNNCFPLCFSIYMKITLFTEISSQKTC